MVIITMLIATICIQTTLRHMSHKKLSLQLKTEKHTKYLILTMQSQNMTPTPVSTSQCLIDHLKKNGPTLILLSGTPGSGKSTLARTIAQQLGICKHFEADQYFEHSNGYHFNANKLGEAHAECQRNAEFYINKGYYVVVANTFTNDWEFKAYERIKKDFILVQLTGTYDNVHGCPAFAVKRMKENLDQRKRKPDFICDPNINKNE